MRVVVIGGTGHIGTFLVPRLVHAGHDVVSVSRGRRAPYLPSAAWQRVEQIELDRAGSHNTFGSSIAALNPQVVIDLIAYTLDEVVCLVEAVRGRVEHLLHCGTIWVHGPSIEVPTSEAEPRRPFGEYGCRKANIERYLLDEAAHAGLPATVLHPGHLVGPGWIPVNPVGNFNPRIFSDLAHGREVLLPNLGMETLHHVHADDVAQAFAHAVERRDVSIGESFHVVSPAALTFRGYAERVAAWFGSQPLLRFVPWDEWRRGASDRDVRITEDHLRHSPHCSIRKARQLLGYAPRYSSLAAIRQSLAHLLRDGVIQSPVASALDERRLLTGDPRL